MRTRTAAFLALAAALLAAAPATAATLEDIKKKGVITFGTDATYPPFESVDKDGKLVGFDIEVGNEVARRLGVKAEFVNTAWDGIFIALNGKKYDAVISSVTITPKRQEAYDFSIPYKDSHQIVVVAKGNDAIKGKDDLKGKKVGVQIGTTSEKEAQAIAGVGEVKSYSTFSEPFMELAFGRIDAIIVNGDVANTFVARYPDKFKRTGEPFLKAVQGIVIRKGEKDLKDALDKAIKEMIEDGWLPKLREKYMV